MDDSDGFVNALNTRLMMLRTMPPKNAGMNPSIVKPETNLAANLNMAALMTSQKMPSVRMVRGNVTIFKNNPRVALIKPITTAAINAALKLVTSKPRTKCVTIIKLTALRNQLIRSLSMRLGDLVKPADYNRAAG